MKKLLQIVIFFLLLIGCQTEKKNEKLKKGLNFEEINQFSGKKFNFNKKNTYSSTNTEEESEIKNEDSHKGCSAACCSDK